MEKRKAEDRKLIFALDIGTRSIVGVVGEPCDGRLKVLAIESAEHEGRTMIDGQIDNLIVFPYTSRRVLGGQTPTEYQVSVKDSEMITEMITEGSTRARVAIMPPSIPETL